MPVFDAANDRVHSLHEEGAIVAVMKRPAAETAEALSLERVECTVNQTLRERCPSGIGGLRIFLISLDLGFLGASVISVARH